MFVTSIWRQAMTLDYRANNQGFFKVPPRAAEDLDYSENPEYPLGSVQRLQWVTRLKEYSITLFQQNFTSGGTEGPVIYQKRSFDTEIGGMDWVVQPMAFDLGVSSVFFLWVTSPGLTYEETFTSHYFNVSDPETSTPTSSRLLADSTSTTLTTSLPSSTMDSIESPQATLSGTGGSEMTPSKSESNTNDIALGIGLGLGIPLLLCVGLLLGLKIAKARRSPPIALATEYQPQDLGPIYASDAHMTKGEHIAELPECIPAVELDSSSPGVFR